MGILLSQFPLTFLSNPKGASLFHHTRASLFHHTAFDYSRADSDGLLDHLKNVPREDILKLGVSNTTVEFCGWVQVEIDVYIPHRKY